MENISPQKLSEEENNIDNSYKETVNAAGILNSAIGTGAVELMKAIFKNPENESVTRKEFKDFFGLVLERYLPIKNMKPKPEGTIPFYDIQQKAVVFLKVNLCLSLND